MENETHLLTGSLDGQTPSLLGLTAPARVDVAVSQLTAASLDELHGGHAERYFSLFQRFCTKAVFGLGRTVALDLLRDVNDFSARILVTRVHQGDGPSELAPDAQLERLRLNVSRWVTLTPVDPEAHLKSVAGLSAALVIRPAVVAIESGEFKASAVLPLELTPAGTGLVAELVDSSLVEPTLIRFLIAPAVGPPPDQRRLISQLSAVEAIRNGQGLSPAVAYRANAVRKGLHRMTNCWLGQPCTVEIQVRSVTVGYADPVIKVLCSELSRPKQDELHAALGERLTRWADSETEPAELLGRPTARALSTDSMSPWPIPNSWITGQGIQPKNITSMRTGFLLVVPPSPQFCDLSSVATSLVEDRTVKRPELWLGGPRICRDSAGHDISLDRESLARHAHVIGVPGSGKTTLLHRMVTADVAGADGLLVLDPHGDLAERVTADSAWRHASGGPVDTAGLAATGRFPGLRILSSNEAGQTTLQREIGTLIEAMEAPLPKIYSGPRFRQLTRACLMLHAHAGHGQPVVKAFDVLHDKDTCDDALQRYSGPNDVRFPLESFWQPSPNDDRPEMADYVTSRITDYLRTEIAERMFAPVGGGLTGLELADSGIRMVLDFARSGISMHDGGMLGQLFLTAFLRSAMTGGHRLDRRFMIYLDEVHLFFGPSVDKLLQEGRKYGLSVVAAHQAASQLSQERFDALMAQTGLEVVFRSSLADSRLLADRLSVSPDSIANLPDFRAWIAGSIAMKRGGAFLADIDPPGMSEHE